MRIGPRLLLNSILIATFAVIATVLLIGAMSFNYGKNMLEQETKDRLTLVRDLKADEIRRYIDSIKREIVLFSDDPTVINAMKELHQGFITYSKEVNGDGPAKYNDAVIKNYIKEFSDDYAKNNNGLAFDATPFLNATNASTFALQYNYIFTNPYGLDKEEQLSYVDDGSTYSKKHAIYHSHLHDLKKLFGLEDIFLVDYKTGNIIYTVAKGLDFTTSLINGPYANTALGAAFRAADNDRGTKDVVISEFEAYSPSNDDQASFVATPIYDEGVKIGILIFQLNADVIDKIMTSARKWSSIGLGATGEAYLVDDQHHILTSSRFHVENSEEFYKDINDTDIDQDTINRMQAKNSTIGLLKINTLGVDEVLQGKTGFAAYKDYRGVEVLGSYEPLNIPGLNWGVIAEIDKSEAFAPVYVLAQKMIINLIGITLLIIIFATIVGLGLAKQISGPILSLSVAVRMLGESHDLTQRINFKSNDEIGDMVQSINHLLDSFQQTYQETVLSSQKMQTTAHKLMSLAEEIDKCETMHKFEDNYDTVHEKTVEIKNASDSLTELSARLQSLSKQFKIFEEDSERNSEW